MIRRFKNNRYFLYFKLGFYILVPLVLLLLPAGYFDKGESICLSQVLFQLECYACGMTRATMHLIHLDFTEAFYYNPLAFAVFPLLAFFWARWFWKDWTRLRALSPVKSTS
ncbi:MAG: DUF2752 domain-containing protein [Saprospirales bacterium]|nr:DUF2752 domain-containing protein [Saprospirales bacterium]MBK6904180.1 DUF2752 domain-containing protein [Saprospirales bacterium]MBK7338865.1 DUF2752 domain-containing protein [Saprospirales bacterium]